MIQEIIDQLVWHAIARYSNLGVVRQKIMRKRSTPPRVQRTNPAKIKTGPSRGLIFSDLLGGRYERPLRNLLQNLVENQIAFTSPILAESGIRSNALQILLSDLVAHSPNSFSSTCC